MVREDCISNSRSQSGKVKVKSKKVATRLKQSIKQSQKIPNLVGNTLKDELDSGVGRACCAL